MKVLLLVLFNLLLYSLDIHAQSPDYSSYEFMYKNQQPADSAAGKSYTQYKNTNTDSTIDTAKVIGFAVAPLYKKQPESPLGNMMADCMKQYAEKMYGKNVDAAFVNFSGIRSYIPKGEITIGTLYKVLPYDNKIVLLPVKGSVMQQFLNHQASLGGWPCAGVSFIIKDKHAEQVLINGKPLDDGETYTIAVADYVANGGNQCTMLKGLPQLNKNYLFRTALIDYITAFTKAGKPVTATIENRIVYSKE